MTGLQRRRRRSAVPGLYSRKPAPARAVAATRLRASTAMPSARLTMQACPTRVISQPLPGPAPGTGVPGKAYHTGSRSGYSSWSSSLNRRKAPLLWIARPSLRPARSRSPPGPGCSGQAPGQDKSLPRPAPKDRTALSAAIASVLTEATAYRYVTCSWPNARHTCPAIRWPERPTACIHALGGQPGTARVLSETAAVRGGGAGGERRQC